MIKKPIILHPFLFALYPILSLYAYNMDIIPLYQIVIPALLTLILTLILLSLSKWIARDYTKAGIVTTLMLVLFFSYGYFFNSGLMHFHIGGFHIGRERYIFSAYILFSIITIYMALFIMKRRQITDRITKFLNIMTSILVVISIANIIIKPLNAPPPVKEENILNSNRNITNTKSLPDIYYIILDMYASSSTLKEIYGYDNTNFDKFLEARGFYLAYKSCCNYAVTDLSLASSLNMEYLGHLRDPERKNQRDRTVLYQMIRNSKPWKVLKSYGYRLIWVSPGYGVTQKNPYADIDICSYGFYNEYLTVLINTTMLSPLFNNFVVPNIIRNRAMHIFEELPKIPHIRGPKFTFVHLPIPHSPYVFGRNGGKVSPFIKTKDKGKYLDQLIFVNKMIPPVIDQILSKSSISPIIIIQADHGPDNTGSLASPTDMLLKERFNILNAYYLPGKDKNNLYESISPVNSFRMIFNLYFDAKLDLLRDISFLSKDEDLYNFKPISREKLEY